MHRTHNTIQAEKKGVFYVFYGEPYIPLPLPSVLDKDLVACSHYNRHHGERMRMLYCLMVIMLKTLF